MLNNDRGRNPIRSGENYEKNRSKHEAKLNRSERDAMCISFQSPNERFRKPDQEAVVLDAALFKRALRRLATLRWMIPRFAALSSAEISAR